VARSSAAGSAGRGHLSRWPQGAGEEPHHCRSKASGHLPRGLSRREVSYPAFLTLESSPLPFFPHPPRGVTFLHLQAAERETMSYCCLATGWGGKRGAGVEKEAPGWYQTGHTSKQARLVPTVRGLTILVPRPLPERQGTLLCAVPAGFALLPWRQKAAKSSPDHLSQLTRRFAALAILAGYKPRQREVPGQVNKGVPTN